MPALLHLYSTVPIPAPVPATPATVPTIHNATVCYLIYLFQVVSAAGSQDNHASDLKEQVHLYLPINIYMDQYLYLHLYLSHLPLYTGHNKYTRLDTIHLATPMPVQTV